MLTGSGGSGGSEQWQQQQRIACRRRRWCHDGRMLLFLPAAVSLKFSFHSRIGWSQSSPATSNFTEEGGWES